MTTVLSLPDYSLHNPYQWLLARALNAHGIEVTHSDGIGRLPVLGSVRAYGRPDVVHVHWPERFGLRGVAELSLLRRRGVRVVWTAHNLGAHDSSHPLRDRLMHMALVRVADAVVTHSEAAKAALARRLRLRRTDKVHVIGHGRYDDVYPMTLDRDAARRSLGLSPRHRVFLAFGQVRRYRGIAELLAAFDEIDDVNARLLVVGRPADEELAAAVRAAAARDGRIIASLGFCATEDVQRYFLAADAVVLPYRDVLTSGVAVLAARFARACIAPQIGELAEILPAGAVIAYDGTDANGLVNALHSALPADLDAMGRAMSNAQLPDWDEVGAKTVAAYGATTRRAVAATATSAWDQRLLLARRDVDASVPAGAAVTLVDDGSLVDELQLCRPLQVFPARDGIAWGAPATDDEAVQALDSLVAGGTRWLVIPWASFWWFDAYPRFDRRLRAVGTCLRRTDRVAVFELRGDRRAA